MIAPAMTVQMWENAATQANIATLIKRGIKMVGPSAGLMACGEEGVGRMTEPAEILNAIGEYFAQPGPLAGKRALVTSGPTYEPLDPVRFIGNRSSGKQGHAIAEALQAKGAETILVSGPTRLPDFPGVETVHVETAREMLAACEAALPADIAVCAAAVADWRPAETASGKLKKGAAKTHVELIENPDILATLAKAANRRPRLVIGFAAETSDVVENATQKFARKNCDWILANEVGSGKGFNQDENEITLLRRDAKGGITSSSWPRQSKDNIARQLADEIALFFAA
jgi:phosphopantothenoylcysteine decarboxylase/phosphopantothenate--cysteine ligase